MYHYVKEFVSTRNKICFRNNLFQYKIESILIRICFNKNSYLDMLNLIIDFVTYCNRIFKNIDKYYYF